MATKMYLVVETDQSHADPVSRLMTELVDQLKSNPSGIRDVRVLSSHKDEHPSSSSSLAIPNPDDAYEDLQVEPYRLAPARKKKQRTTELICGPDVAITAETSVDPSGKAHAKLTMHKGKEREKTKETKETKETKKEIKKETFVCQSVKKEGKEEVFVCRRRNGLDPTPAELRGERKFEYLPLKTNIPEFKCLKPHTMPDHGSSGSVHSGLKVGRNTEGCSGGMMKKNCPANIPEARINKYNACINRRNGLQDKCDSLSKNALKSCRKSK